MIDKVQFITYMSHIVFDCRRNTNFSCVRLRLDSHQIRMELPRERRTTKARKICTSTPRGRGIFTSTTDGYEFLTTQCKTDKSVRQFNATCSFRWPFDLKGAIGRNKCLCIYRVVIMKHSKHHYLFHLQCLLFQVSRCTGDF